MSQILTIITGALVITVYVRISKIGIYSTTTASTSNDINSASSYCVVTWSKDSRAISATVINIRAASGYKPSSIVYSISTIANTTSSIIDTISTIWNTSAASNVDSASWNELVVSSVNSLIVYATSGTNATSGTKWTGIVSGNKSRIKWSSGP